MEILNRISMHPEVLDGRPCIRDTRLLVSLLLRDLADGQTQTEILKNREEINDDDVRQALLFAARLCDGLKSRVPAKPDDR